MMKKTLLFILTLTLLNTISAQWRCKSEIGSYLKPITKENGLFSWAFELLVSGAVIDHYVATNDFAILALQYQKKQHKLYLEGGIKFYNIYDFKNKLNPYHLRPGFKELFYQFSDQNWGKLKVGIQSMRSNDDYLLNERVLGITYKVPLKTGAISLNAGTVKKDFSINGTFCTTGFLYDIMPDKVRPILGNGLGQSNFAMVSYDFKPMFKKKEVSEFEEFSEFESEVDQKKSVSLENLGIVAYSEFGSWIPKPITLAGLYASIDFGHQFYLFPEVLYQVYQDSSVQVQNGMIYSLKLVKRVNWKNGDQTQLNIHYIGYEGFKGNSMAMNSFSNIFGGTVLRLDVPELPFIKTGIRHIIEGKTEQSFAHNMELKLYGTTQIGTQNMWELDGEIGKTFHFDKYIKFSVLLNLQYAYLVAPFDGISNPNRGAHLFRIESRITF